MCRVVWNLLTLLHVPCGVSHFTSYWLFGQDVVTISELAHFNAQKLWWNGHMICGFLINRLPLGTLGGTSTVSLGNCSPGANDEVHDWMTGWVSLDPKSARAGYPKGTGRLIVKGWLAWKIFGLVHVNSLIAINFHKQQPQVTFGQIFTVNMISYMSANTRDVDLVPHVPPPHERLFHGRSKKRSLDRIF